MKKQLWLIVALVAILWLMVVYWFFFMPRPIVNTEIKTTHPITAVAPNGDGDVLQGYAQVNALVTIGENYRCELTSELGSSGVGFYADDGRYLVAAARMGVTHYLLNTGNGFYVWQESEQDTLSYMASYSVEDNSKMAAMVSLETGMRETRLHPLTRVKYICAPVANIEEERFLVPEEVDFQEVEMVTNIDAELFVN